MSAQPAHLWLIILGGMIVTYATRLAFVALVPHERLPARFRQALRFVAPSVLAALILPDLLRPAGPYDLTLDNHRMLAGAIAALVAWRTQNTWLTISVGMLALWGLSLL